MYVFCHHVTIVMPRAAGLMHHLIRRTMSTLASAPAPAPALQSWIPELGEVALGHLYATAVPELMLASESLASRIDRPFATIAGSSGS